MQAVAGNGFVHSRQAAVPFATGENERSLAFVVQFGDFDYLIGGDMIGRSAGSEDARVERAVGQYLVAEGIDIDVLHVGHHGADNASDTEFLEQIRPEVAIISLGNGNPHGHPNAGALNRLVAAGVSRIYQTEYGTTEAETTEAVRIRQSIFQGDIILTTDGTTYTISTSRVFTTDGN